MANLQSAIQRIDLGSSISSNASSLQSSVAQSLEDDNLLQYTYHGVSRKPSVTDSLFTRSDSALCVPTIKRRIVTVNKKNTIPVVKEVPPFKEPANDMAEVSLVVNNYSSSLPLQANQSTEDVSVQADLPSSNQSADNKSKDVVLIVMLNLAHCCRNCSTANC